MRRSDAAAASTSSLAAGNSGAGAGAAQAGGGQGGADAAKAAAARPKSRRQEAAYSFLSSISLFGSRSSSSSAAAATTSPGPTRASISGGGAQPLRGQSPYPAGGAEANEAYELSSKASTSSSSATAPGATGLTQPAPAAAGRFASAQPLPAPGGRRGSASADDGAEMYISAAAAALSGMPLSTLANFRSPSSPQRGYPPPSLGFANPTPASEMTLPEGSVASPPAPIPVNAKRAPRRPQNETSKESANRYAAFDFLSALDLENPPALGHREFTPVAASSSSNAANPASAAGSKRSSLYNPLVPADVVPPLPTMPGAAGSGPSANSSFAGGNGNMGVLGLVSTATAGSVSSSDPSAPSSFAASGPSAVANPASVPVPVSEMRRTRPSTTYGEDAGFATASSPPSTSANPLSPRMYPLDRQNSGGGVFRQNTLGLIGTETGLPQIGNSMGAGLGTERRGQGSLADSSQSTSMQSGLNQLSSQQGRRSSVRGNHAKRTPQMPNASGPGTGGPTGLGLPHVHFLKGLDESHARLTDRIGSSKMFFALPKSGPFAVVSVLRYHDDRILKLRAKKANRQISVLAMEKSDDGEENKHIPVSYEHLIKHTGTLVPNTDSTLLLESYDPYYLDDPELRTGKHRTVITLPCFMGSVLQYARPEDLKRELNEQFLQRHAGDGIDTSLALSHIRSLKNKMLRIGQDQDLELSTVAKAYVYLERLILKGSVNRDNRHAVAGICLLLASKVNDPIRNNYKQLISSVENLLGVPEKVTLDHEFAVFVALEFDLYSSPAHVLPHFRRIAAAMDAPPTNYFS